MSARRFVISIFSKLAMLAKRPRQLERSDQPKCAKAGASCKFPLTQDPLSHMFAFLALRDACRSQAVCVVFEAASKQSVWYRKTVVIELHSSKTIAEHTQESARATRRAASDAMACINRNCHCVQRIRAEYDGLFLQSMPSLEDMVQLYPELLDRLHQFWNHIDPKSLVPMVSMQLRQVALWNVPETSTETLAIVARNLPKLRHLEISNMNEIAFLLELLPRLLTLEINSANMTHRMASAMARMPLRALMLNMGHIPRAVDLEMIADAAPQLRVLSVTANHHWRHSGWQLRMRHVRNLVQRVPNLVYLWLWADDVDNKDDEYEFYREHAHKHFQLRNYTHECNPRSMQDAMRLDGQQMRDAVGDDADDFLCGWPYAMNV